MVSMLSGTGNSEARNQSTAAAIANAAPMPETIVFTVCANMAFLHGAARSEPDEISNNTLRNMRIAHKNNIHISMSMYAHWVEALRSEAARVV